MILDNKQKEEIYSKIKKSFKLENYILLSSEYKNAHQLLEYVCPNKHNHKISWVNWQQNKRCPYCAGNAKPSINEIRKLFKKEKYILLCTQYKNEYSKLQYKCPKGHLHEVSLLNWKQGDRCPYCAGNAKPNINEIRKLFKNEGYILATDIKYKNNIKPLQCICPKGHKIQISWGNWQKGHRCGQCFMDNNFSKGEKDLLKYVVNLYTGKVIENDRSILINPKTGYNLEIDIWMPEIKKAIEYNGEYWHRNRKYIDEIKQEQCKEKGIDLLIIEDKNWKENIAVAKNLVKDFIGVNNEAG